MQALYNPFKLTLSQLYLINYEQLQAHIWHTLTHSFIHIGFHILFSSQVKEPTHRITCQEAWHQSQVWYQRRSWHLIRYWLRYAMNVNPQTLEEENWDWTAIFVWKCGKGVNNSWFWFWWLCYESTDDRCKSKEYRLSYPLCLAILKINNISSYLDYNGYVASPQMLEETTTFKLQFFQLWNSYH